MVKGGHAVRLTIGIALLSGLGAFAAAQEKTPGQAADGGQELEKGKVLLARQQYPEAIKAFKEANRLAGNSCAECYLNLGAAYRNLGDFKSAVESEDRAIKAAGDDKAIQARGHNLKGLFLLAWASNPSDKKVNEAENEFRAALALDPTLAAARFNLGYSLLKQGRDAEGVRELQPLLSQSSDEVDTAETRRLIANPRRAREAYAPDFTLTMLGGDSISSDSLRGKVVLLDFWGSGYRACLDALPSLANFNKRFSGRPFVLIGVSSDTDESKWRDFVSSHRTNWPQSLDESRRMQQAFRVSAFPIYILIDAEGIIRYRSSATDGASFAQLEDQINKSLKSSK